MYVSRIPKHMVLQYAKLKHPRKIDTSLNIYCLLNLLLFVNAEIGPRAVMSLHKGYKEQLGEGENEYLHLDFNK